MFDLSLVMHFTKLLPKNTEAVCGKLQKVQPAQSASLGLRLHFDSKLKQCSLKCHQSRQQMIFYMPYVLQVEF